MRRRSVVVAGSVALAVLATAVLTLSLGELGVPVDRLLTLGGGELFALLGRRRLMALALLVLLPLALGLTRRLQVVELGDELAGALGARAAGPNLVAAALTGALILGVADLIVQHGPDRLRLPVGVTARRWRGGWPCCRRARSRPRRPARRDHDRRVGARDVRHRLPDHRRPGESPTRRAAARW